MLDFGVKISAIKVQNIPLLGLDNSSLISNSWLSGFFDADGSFYLNWSKNEKDIVINLQYYLRMSLSLETKFSSWNLFIF